MDYISAYISYKRQQIQSIKCMVCIFLRSLVICYIMMNMLCHDNEYTVLPLGNTKTQ